MLLSATHYRRGRQRILINLGNRQLGWQTTTGLARPSVQKEPPSRTPEWIALARLIPEPSLICRPFVAARYPRQARTVLTSLPPQTNDISTSPSFAQAAGSSGRRLAPVRSWSADGAQDTLPARYRAGRAQGGKEESSYEAGEESALGTGRGLSSGYEGEQRRQLLTAAAQLPVAAAGPAAGNRSRRTLSTGKPYSRASVGAALSPPPSVAPRIFAPQALDLGSGTRACTSCSDP